MKRDMDLVRQLLFYIEANQKNEPFQSDYITMINGYEEGAAGYHLKIMVDGGLIDATDISTFDSVSWDFLIHNITWSGHDFLDSVRDDNVWNHTKSALKPFASASFEIVKSIAVAYISSKLGLP